MAATRTQAAHKSKTPEKKPGTANSDAALFDRLPPQSLECEMGVLGSMILDPHVCDEVFLTVDARAFYSDANRIIFRIIKELHEHGRKIDATLLHNTIKQQGYLDFVGGLAYLLELVDSVPHASNAVYYAKEVHESGIRRELIYSGTELIREAYAEGIETGEVIARYERKLADLCAARNADQLHNGVDVGLSLLHRLKKGKPQGKGIEFGLFKLDQTLEGMHKNQLILIAARTSVGKTALATHLVAHQLQETDNSCYFCSLEMDEDELTERILVNMAKVDTHRLRNHWCNEDEIKRLTEAVAMITPKRLQIDRAAYRTVSEVVGMARRAKRLMGKLDYIIVDYLQLMDSQLKGRPRHEQVSDISRGLKNAAKDLGVPIIALAQLNRESDGSRPRLSHLRESGSLEQDADKVIFIDRDTTDDEKGALATLIVAKNRKGKLGDSQAAWFGGFQRFQSMDGDNAF